MLISLLFLSACSSTPSIIALSPQLDPIAKQLHQVVPIAISSSDARSDNAVVKINQANGKVTLVSPAESPSLQLENMVRTGLSQAGYRIDPASSTHMNIALSTLLTDVNQSTFDYETKSNIIINVTATSGNKTLTKQYTIRGSRSDILTADYASLELELNKLLAEITRSIIVDPELNRFLTGANQ
ncbi:YajG family lipoprotein [Shewanella sp. SNU WT4]|uniref:YajG family lipoprotein n=1 Tax=Shewanella sp. SNU WT4 TaxID=2590015 RepID=UPI00143DEBA3|nr:YajG family lipoprotein [Shewanella sp. SNU WT4]